MLKLFIFCSIITAVRGAEKCKSCKEQVAELLDMAKSIMTGVEPLQLKDIEVCKFINAKGMKTMKTTGDPCIKKLDKTKYLQKITMGFDRIQMSCQLKDLAGFMKYLGIPAIPTIPLPKISLFGKKEKPKEPVFNLTVDWKNLLVDTEMELDFTNDKYEVTKCQPTEINMNNIKLGCAGENLIMQSCKFIIGQKPIQLVISLLVQLSVKYVVGIMLKVEELKSMFTMLNCGEPDEE